MDQQVEVALPVANLRVDNPVKCVRERSLVLRQELQLIDDHARLAPLRLGRPAEDSDQIAQGDLETLQPIVLDEELNLPAAVDEIEEHQPAEVTPGKNATCEAHAFFGLASGLDSLCDRTHGRDLGPVRKSLRQPRHRHESR